MWAWPKSAPRKSPSRIRPIDTNYWLLEHFCKGPATLNDFVNDIVNDARADAIFATLKAIVDDIVTCGMAFSLLSASSPLLFLQPRNQPIIARKSWLATVKLAS